MTSEELTALQNIETKLTEVANAFFVNGTPKALRSAFKDWKKTVEPARVILASALAIKGRLEYLRGELRAERISYGELSELQFLAPHIEPDDVELLEAAGVEEKP